MANLSLSKLPWYAQIGAMVAIAIAVGGAFYYFYEMPQQELIAAQAKELSEIRGRISRGQAMARQLPEFRKEVADLQMRLDSLRPILPDEKDAADLLRRVHTLATQSNLTIRSFRPQAISTKTLHAEWPISLELEGTYHNLGLFLDRVSKFPRIINVSGIAIETRDEPQPNATIAVTCTATTFVLLDTPTPAATKAAKKS